MALGRAFSLAVRGLDGEIVEIEADITSGLPGVHLVGLPDAALQESRHKQLLPACQTLGLIFLVYAYVLNGWIP